jgi:protein FrlC
LKDIDYQGTATIELVTGYINEPRMYGRRAINNIREMMDKAGY